MNSQIIGLNVGGKEIMTSKNTLCSVSGSKLEKMFNEGYEFQKVGDKADKIFLDRNGDIF